jgi:hypothetical protein
MAEVVIRALGEPIDESKSERVAEEATVAVPADGCHGMRVESSIASPVTVTAAKVVRTDESRFPAV